MGRTAFIVGLTFTMLLFSFLDIVFFLISGINIVSNRLIVIPIIIIGVLLVQLLRYIYITRGRYELIRSSEYETFSLSTTIGVTICIIVFFVSILSLTITGITINTLVKG